MLTTYGSPIYRDFVPKADAAMVALVRKAGAVIVAKTNVPEFGAGANSRNPVWGATGNPFNPALNPGGSSGGSAVALACDMLPVCTGSDTGGSLRIPAAMCGVVGFRPSPGVVPMDLRSLGWTPISVLGPMGRTVADTRLLFSAQVGMDDREPLAFPLRPEEVTRARPVDLGRLRVAWTEDFGQCPVGQEIREVMRERIGAMRHLFRTCDEVRFDFGEADKCFDVVRAQNFVARYQVAYDKDPSSLGPNVRANYEAGAKMSLKDAAWAHAEQTRIFRRFQANFRDSIWCCRRPRRCRRFRGRSSIWQSSRAASSTTTIIGSRSPTTSRSSPIRRSRCPAASTTRACRSAFKLRGAFAPMSRCWTPPRRWSRRSPAFPPFNARGRISPGSPPPPIPSSNPSSLTRPS